MMNTVAAIAPKNKRTEFSSFKQVKDPNITMN